MGEWSQGLTLKLPCTLDKRVKMWYNKITLKHILGGRDDDQGSEAIIGRNGCDVG